MDLALFDFDGTITDSDAFSGGDSFSRFIHFAVRPARKLAGALPLGPVVLGYRLGWIPASRARRAVVWVGFRGESVSRIRQLGVRFAAEVLAPTARPRALERIRWHQDQGHEVVVVSAALDVYLRPWCETHAVQCLCTELQQRGGLLTGAYQGGDCSGSEKARRVVTLFPPTQHRQVWAYGDTADDHELLQLAHRKYYRWREVK